MYKHHLKSTVYFNSICKKKNALGKVPKSAELIVSRFAEMTLDELHWKVSVVQLNYW